MGLGTDNKKACLIICMDSLYTSNKNLHDNVQIIFGLYNMYKKSPRTYVWWPLCTSIWTADYIFQKLDQMAAL